MLIHNQLEALEARWRRIDAPLVTRLRPGLEPADLDRIAAAAGLLAERFEWSWRPLRITRFSYGAVIVDCTVGDGAPSPVRLMAWQEPDDAERTRSSWTRSGEHVPWWVDAPDSGAWSIAPGTRRWVDDDSRIERERAITGLF